MGSGSIFHVKVTLSQRQTPRRDTIHHPFGLGTVLHAQFLRATIEQAAKQKNAAKP